MGIKVLEVNVDDYLHGGVYQLVTEWVRLMPPEFKIDIAALEPFEDPAHIEALKEQNCDVYYVGADINKIKKQRAIYRNMRELIEREHYDVVHLHSDVAHKILVSGLAAKKCKVPKIIFHSHANDVEGSHKKLRIMFHKMCAKVLKGIPAVRIATSEDAGKWMFPGSKNFIVLDNGIDYAKYYYSGETRERVRQEMGLEDRFVIGFVGRFVDQKNPFYLLDIMSRVHTEIPDAVLVCIGQGRFEDEFKSRARDMGLDEKIIMLGGVDNVPDYYQAMDALIMPSNFEGFGLVAVEAQISGTPIIASEYVPDMTRISDLITYLPIGAEDADKWAEALKGFKAHAKYDVRAEIDHKYDMSRMIATLADIYGNS